MSNIKRTQDGPCNHTNFYPSIPNRLVKIHRNMLRRCYKPSAKDYRFYGAKGINVCEEWLKNPSAFFGWALSTGYTDEMTIDRIDSKKNYCPENCRWVTAKNNSKFKATTRLITIDGITDSLSGWAERTHIPKTTLVGWSKKRTDEEVVDYINRKKDEK